MNICHTSLLIFSFFEISDVEYVQYKFSTNVKNWNLYLEVQLRV